MSDMGRLPRPIEDGLVSHALNRGNNRAPVFGDDADFRAFLEALGQTQGRYPFRLFGYCLMSNHFHLLLGPEAGQSISRILQSLTVAHTWRYHKGHRSSGHVWQGRFKSPLVQADAHLLVVLRYIEANPLRAAMVRDAADYPWSSYQHHGLGAPDPLLSPLPQWDELGRTPGERRSRWRAKVHAAQSDRDLAAVRRAVQTGRPYGEQRWVERMARTLDIPLAARPRGRPRKQTTEK
jgi:putative transposase